MERIQALSDPAKCLNPRVWYRLSEKWKGTREMPKDWELANAVMKRKKKKIRPHQQKPQSLIFLDSGQQAGPAGLMRPEAASLLHSDSVALPSFM